jgi:hypothetical protein
MGCAVHNQTPTASAILECPHRVDQARLPSIHPTMAMTGNTADGRSDHVERSS